MGMENEDGYRMGGELKNTRVVEKQWLFVVLNLANNNK